MAPEAVVCGRFLPNRYYVQSLARSLCASINGSVIAFHQNGRGANAMLRITSLDELDRVTGKIEGSLAGVWLVELEAVWRGVYWRLDGSRLYLAMKRVEHVDRAGTYMFALRRQRGYQLRISRTL